MQDHLTTAISFEVNDNMQTLGSLQRKDPGATTVVIEEFEEK
jgi:hypothetical protein